MPYYEYQCAQCNETFEVQATIKEKIAGLTVVCPKCGNRDVRQRLTAAMVMRGGRETVAPVCGPNGGAGCCG